MSINGVYLTRMEAKRHVSKRREESLSNAYKGVVSIVVYIIFLGRSLYGALHTSSDNTKLDYKEVMYVYCRSKGMRNNDDKVK